MTIFTGAILRPNTVVVDRLSLVDARNAGAFGFDYLAGPQVVQLDLTASRVFLVGHSDAVVALGDPVRSEAYDGLCTPPFCLPCYGLRLIMARRSAPDLACEGS